MVSKLFKRLIELLLGAGFLAMFLGYYIRVMFNWPDAVYIVLGGYGLCMIPFTVIGIYGHDDGGPKGQSCCVSGFLSVFAFVWIFTIFSNIYGLYWITMPLGMPIIIFTVFYVFMSVIIGILRQPKSSVEPSSHQEGVSEDLPKPIEYQLDGEESHHDRVIEREELLGRMIPPYCFKCEVDISPEKVDWIGPDTVRCPHCGASLVVEFERV